MMNKSRRKDALTAGILKALGIFGGVQVISIICSVLRNKLAALWLGPAGMGLIVLYNSAIDLISGVTQLNMRQSAVRDLSQSSGSSASASIIHVVRRIALILGIIGVLVTLLASPLISRISFGDSSHTVDFAMLSPMLLFTALASGESAIMQGTGMLSSLARSSVLAAVTSTAAAIPLFWFFRMQAVVPVLLIFAVSNCAYAFIYRRRHVPLVHMPLREVFKAARPMLALGMYMTIGITFVSLASYVFTAFLNRHYSEATVGIYQAGFTLVNTYVGMIFTAISMEYYPRLSAISSSPLRISPTVSHEISVALSVLIPVSVVFICCRELMLSMLYSSQFHAAAPYLSYGIIGVPFRAMSFCLAFTILARGDGRMYVLTELLSTTVGFGLNILLFNAYSFAGLGVAYILWYAFYTLITYMVYRQRYHCQLSRGVWTMLAICLCFSVLTLVMSNVLGYWLTAIAVLPLSLIFSYRRLRSRQ